jgi:hypothetical protein
MTRFLKLRCERAYNTGAIRTNFALPELAGRLQRAGLAARCSRDSIEIDTADETFVFGDWQREGLTLVGWLRFTTEGDVGGLSWKLAKQGIRHRLELSRPRDLDTDDVRCVTRYDYRWDSPGLRRAGQVEPSILTFDEAI